MDGVINIFKHAGVSSHDIVQNLRKILKTKKVGHTGTLDPDAVGVLPICVGKATRLVEFLTSSTKTYRALLVFGRETDTQDGSGKVLKTTPLPKHNVIEFTSVLRLFLGEIEQIPPMYSAIKIKGQPLYQLARQGQSVQLEPRKIKIFSINLLSYDTKTALIEVCCSKGTYIRTLCQDIGKAVNSSAYMSFLLRTKSGQFNVNDSFTIDEVSQLPIERFLVKPADSIKEWPQLFFNKEEMTKVSHGNAVSLSSPAELCRENQRYKVLDVDGNLVAIGIVTDGLFKPEKVFR
ncbi:MAG: tRNA pseudouridine(55) synthase TruB [Bacillota bacterium]